MNQIFKIIENSESLVASMRKSLLDHPDDETLALALKKEESDLDMLREQLGYKESKPTAVISSTLTDKRAWWSKPYTYFPIIFAPIGKESVFCFGYILIDDFLKQISVAHVNNNIFKKKGIKINPDKFDFEWVFGIFRERLKKNPDINYHLKGDSYFGERSIGSSLFLDHISRSCSKGAQGGGLLIEYKIRPAVEYAKEMLVRDSMIDLDDGDIVVYQISMTNLVNQESTSTTD